jgi:hypothetical protein
MGVLKLPGAQLELLNQLGHSLALYFVLPVGTVTSLINFSSHRKRRILSLAGVGIFLVGIANAHFHHLPAAVASLTSPTLVQSVERVLSAVQDCGGSASPNVIPWHRITNVAGCAMLLSSNYLSQQQQGCAYHDHHDHVGGGGEHGHNHSHDCHHGHDEG